MKININFLQHRRNYIPLVIETLNRIKPENKKQIKVNWLMTDHLDFNSFPQFVPE